MAAWAAAGVSATVQAPVGMRCRAMNSLAKLLDHSRREGTRVLTDGGRVLGVTATGPRVQAARARAYRAAKAISFEGAAFRADIGGEEGGPA